MNKLFVIVLVFIFSQACASGTNPYFTNKNTMGLIGGGAGAVGGAMLCKNCKGMAKVAAIGGGALLGLLGGSAIGNKMDVADQNRQTKLIQSVLENNRDNQASTDTYTKSNWKNPNTGKQEPAVVSQTAVPLRTYKQQTPDIAPLNNQYGNFGIPPKYNMNNTRMASNDCRDIRVDFEVKGITPEPQRTQFYSFCRQESGWRMLP